LGKKLYVGNLSYGVDDTRLSEMFSQFGTVESARIISDRSSGRSKGFGFVEMATDGEATEAIQALNSTEQDGRKIIVSEAREEERGSRGGGGGGGYGGGGGRGGGGYGGGGGRGGDRGGFGGGGGRGGDRGGFGGGGGRGGGRGGDRGGNYN
jgi:RNA recognition motif-containing protein